MTARKRAPRKTKLGVLAPEEAAAVDTMRDLGMGVGRNSEPTAAQAVVVAAAVVAATPPTQVRRPWRSTIRTVVQVVLGVAPLLPAIVGASGVDDSLPAVAAALALSAGITRVMGLPAVEGFLQRFVPWLAASPRSAPI